MRFASWGFFFLLLAFLLFGGTFARIIFAPVSFATIQPSKRARDSALRTSDARSRSKSFAIAAGLNAKTLSTYMGHANIAITLDLYGHLLPGNEAESADLLHAFHPEGAYAPDFIHPPPTSPLGEFEA